MPGARMPEGGDPAGMRLVYDRWPEIAAGAWRGGIEPVDLGGAGHLVFAGMGGSGAVGDVLAAVMSGTGTRVTVTKGYHLPAGAGPDTAVVVTSVSGDTAEAASVLAEAAGAGARAAAFSSGGRLERMCAEGGIPHRRVPMEHSPRASFAAYLYSIIRALGGALPLSGADVEESLAALGRVRARSGGGAPPGANAAARLARAITGTPVIYYPWGLQAAATRFKNSLQENAKAHAMAEDVVEACHNGVVAWDGGGGGFVPVMIRGPDDHEKTRELWGTLGRFFDGRGVRHASVEAERGGILTKLACLVYELDYASIYLAALRGVDPTPIGPIDEIKGRT